MLTLRYVRNITKQYTTEHYITMNVNQFVSFMTGLTCL